MKSSLRCDNGFAHSQAHSNVLVSATYNTGPRLRTQSYRAYPFRHRIEPHSLILSCVILLSGSIATVAKKDTYIPSRRTGKGPLGAKVFSYYTQDERRLVEKAAKLEHRSLSSFVAIAAVERAQRVLGRN